MGEVYRARDTRLKRDVAVKVLPPAFAHDPDRLARFQREAEVLATLNHPNIAAVYGFEETQAASGIVLELVEGPTLRDRIAHGPIPIDEALAIARQIADALEAAHEKNVIHRDLKPANIKVTPNGTDQSPGLRSGQDDGQCRLRSAQAGAGILDVTDVRHRSHVSRLDSWDRGLHEPGAGARQTSGRSHRHLVVRLCALRNAHGSSGVRDRRDRVGCGRRDSHSRARLECVARESAGADSAAPSPMSREGSRPPAAPRRRRAPRDRRRDERAGFRAGACADAHAVVATAFRSMGRDRGCRWPRDCCPVDPQWHGRVGHVSRQTIGAHASHRCRTVRVESERRRFTRWLARRLRWRQVRDTTGLPAFARPVRGHGVARLRQRHRNILRTRWTFSRARHEHGSVAHGLACGRSRDDRHGWRELSVRRHVG